MVSLEGVVEGIVVFFIVVFLFMFVGGEYSDLEFVGIRSIS